MKVTVKLIGPFIHTIGFSEKELDVPPGTTAEGIQAMINIEKSRPKIVTRNGKAISSNDGLQDGDRIVISPIYSGG